MNNIRVDAGFAGGLFVDREGLGGGLALMWDTTIAVEVQSYSKGHIDAIVRMEDGQPWRFTGFYSDSNDSQRRHSLTLPRCLKTIHNLPWLCGGDFNETLFSSEKRGSLPSNGAHMRAFQECFGDFELNDLGFTSYPFTWSNKQDDNLIEKRLDRMVANADWIRLFPRSTVKHVLASHSDHIPLLMHTDDTLDQQPKRCFVPRYEPFWLGDVECLDIVNNNWHPPSSLQALNDTIIDLRDCLKHWSSAKYGSLSRKMDRLRKLIDRRMLATNCSAMELSTLQAQLAHLESLHEEYWRQRSRAEWLKLGDKNTSYFHHKASSRKERNEIAKIRNPGGEILQDPSQIENTIRDNFMEMFTTDHTLLPLPPNATFQSLSPEQRCHSYRGFPYYAITQG